MKIKIVSVPQGEAPFEVREEWIGTELEGRPYYRSIDGRLHGVLTGHYVERDSSADFVCGSKYAVAQLKAACNKYYSYHVLQSKE